MARGAAVSTNEFYWEELREYVWGRHAYRRIGFVAENASAYVANGVRLELRVPDSDQVSVVERLPSKPKRQISIPYSDNLMHVSSIHGSDLSIGKHGDEWHVEIHFGKLQPGARSWSPDVYIVCGTEGDVVLDGKVFSDDFEPIPLSLVLHSSPTMRKMSMADLKQVDEEGDDQDEA